MKKWATTKPKQERAIPTKCRFCSHTLVYIDFRDVNGNPHVWPYCDWCKRKQIRALTRDEKDLLRRAGLIVTPPEFSKAYSLYATIEETPQQAKQSEIECLSEIVRTTPSTQEMAAAAMQILEKTR